MKCLFTSRSSGSQTSTFAFGAVVLAVLVSSTASAQQAQPPAKPPVSTETKQVETKPTAPPAPTESPAPAPPAETKPAETKPAETKPAETTAPTEAAPAEAAPPATATPSETPAPAAAVAPAAAPATPPPATTSPTATTPATPATPPLTGEGSPKSASANQGVEPPADDYDSAETQVAEEEKEPSDLMLNIMLDLTIPLGAASDFIGGVSVQGFSIDVRYFAFGNVGIGASVAFDSLSKKESGTVVWDNTTITGVHRRDLSFTPILLKGYYAWRDKEKFIPYVALGAGASRTARRLNAGYFVLDDDSWHFTLSPEVGIHIPVGPTVLIANGRLGYLVAGGGQDAQMFGNLSVGLSIQ